MSHGSPTAGAAKVAFVDFDGTITLKDTINTLAKFGIAIQRSRGNDLRRTWDDVVQKYTADRERFDEKYEPAAHLRTAVTEESRYLASLEAVEARSIRRVEASGIFRDLSPAELVSAGRQAVADGDVQVRPGFQTFLQCADHKGWRVLVISVNWSTPFIQGVLDAACERQLDVVANEIAPDGTISGPRLLQGGNVSGLLATSADKLAVMKALIGKLSPSGDYAITSSVYIGDSMTDLDCLLQSRGIVISDGGDSSLLKTLRRLGHEVHHISNFALDASICWARDFNEVVSSGWLS